MENNMEELKKDYILTLFETCEILNKSSRTIGRYIRKGILHPLGIKSRQGTLEYRFSKNEIEAFKKQEDELRQVTYLRRGMMPIAGDLSFAAPNMQHSPTAVHVPYVSSLQEQIETKKMKDEAIKNEPTKEKTEQDAKEIQEKKEDLKQPSPDKEIIYLLKETTEILRDQLQVKDEQIKSLNDKIDNLIERDRETNILLKGMQDKILRLEQPKDSRDTAGFEEAKSKETIETKPAKEVAEIKENNIEKKDTQDKGEKDKKNNKQDNKQKKNKETKQKKGFFGGLFG